MSEVLVDTTATCAGQPAIVVQSGAWRIVVLPTLGGKIWELEYRPKAFQFLWHNPKLAPRAVAFGAGYDDAWSGGWDDVFPTDAPYVHGREQLPDHGEFWSVKWQYEVVREANDVVLHLWSVGPVTRARFDKWIRIPAEDVTLQMRYRIVNPAASLPFLFKLHPALRITDRSRIILPRCRFTPDSEFSTWFPSMAQPLRWPYARKADGSSVDLRKVETREPGVTLFGYADELEHGYCGLIHPEQEIAFGLAFPREVLPYCWMFASYGGFQGHNVLVLEPCTANYWRLEECVKNGSARTLGTGEAFETVVSIVAVEMDREDELARVLQSVSAGDFSTFFPGKNGGPS